MFEPPLLLTAPTDGADQRRRRVLLVSYHFPPSDSTGSLRWQKLVGYAAEAGWDVDVLTRHPAELNAIDRSRLSQLPASTRVFGVRCAKPSGQTLENAAARLIRIFKRRKAAGAVESVSQDSNTSNSGGNGADLIWRDNMRWSFSLSSMRKAYRAWRFFSEEWRWARGVINAARTLKADYAAVISCGPPHVPHLAAVKIARQRRCPFVMDMRDPWSLAPAMPTAFGHPLWYSFAERYEARTVSAAALVVANTGALATAMRKKYPHRAARIITVMNGCDDELIKPQRAQTFIACYAGNIYIDRDPRLLFRAMARAIQQEGISPQQFRIELIGHVEQFGGAPVAQIAQEEGVADYLTIYPRVPRSEVLRLMGRASLLLSLPQDVDLAIPSKIFEYMQYPAWMLALAKPGSATHELLATSSASVVHPDDVAAMTTIICDCWRQFSAGRFPKPVNAAGGFSRRAQAALLFDALAKVVATNSPAVRSVMRPTPITSAKTVS